MSMNMPITFALKKLLYTGVIVGFKYAKFQNVNLLLLSDNLLHTTGYLLEIRIGVLMSTSVVVVVDSDSLVFSEAYSSNFFWSNFNWRRNSASLPLYNKIFYY